MPNYCALSIFLSSFSVVACTFHKGVPTCPIVMALRHPQHPAHSLTVTVVIDWDHISPH